MKPKPTNSILAGGIYYLMAALFLAVLWHPVFANRIAAAEPAGGDLSHGKLGGNSIRWVGERPPTEQDNQELLEVLGDRGKMEQFVNSHSDSSWTPAMRNALATGYRHAGRNTSALSHWDAAWKQLKDAINPDAREEANHALANQLELLSSLGRMEVLHELLTAADGRLVQAHNDRRRIETAREAYEIMVHYPSLSYRCGSLALANLARVQAKPVATINALIEEPSTKSGISLHRLVELNRQHDLGLVAVKRNDTAPVPVPAVVHWALNHYGALLEYRADIDSYRIVDPTFDAPRWISAADLDAETSGYFLVPENQKSASWQIVSDQECDQVFGRGYLYNMDDTRDKGCKPNPTNPKQKCPPCPTGMPVWWVTEPYVNLWLADEPWSYTTSRGEQMALRVSIKQRDSITNAFGYPRPGLLHNWYSKIYIRGMATSVAAENAFSDWSATLHLGTGGERTYSKTSLYDEESKTQLQPSYGVLTDGTEYIVPGFPLGTSTNIPPAASWYDPVSGFRVFYPDGSVDRYGYIYWRTNATAGFYECEALLTEQSDPLGNSTRLVYECYNNCASDPQTRQYRLKQVIDYDGKTNTFVYFTNNAGVLQQVVSPYSQTATFAYDAQGNLTNITDAVSLSSSLNWDANGRVTALQTPYGTNSFSYYELPISEPLPTGGHDRVNRAITVVDANGGTNLYVYRFDSPSFLSPQFSTNDIPESTPLGTLDTGTNTAGGDFAAISFRNSFHWNPRQCATLSTTVVTNLTASDYLKARMRHWLGDSNNVAVVDLVSVEQEPSPDGTTEGQKTFYDYEGKTLNYLQGTNSQTGVIARRQLSGHTEYTWSQFNSSGYVTREISTYTLADGVPETRTNVYVYATNTVSYTMLTTCAFCPPGTAQLAGCSQPPSGTSANVYLQGAYKLNTVNTSKVSWVSLLLVLTNADQSSVRYGGNQQRTETTTVTCGGWQEAVTKTYTSPLPAKATNEAGYVTTYTYNSDNQLTSVRTPSGLTITNRYDSLGFLTNTVDREIGRTNSYSYTNGLVFIHGDERGLRTTNTWDKLQRLVASTDVEGYISNRYDKLDLAATRDKLDHWTYFGYDPLRQLTAITNANQEIALAQYCQCGSLEWTRDPLGNFTFYNFDLAGRLTNIAYPDGYSVTNTFNALGQWVQTADAVGRTTNQYNLQGLLTASLNAAGLIRSNSFDIMDRRRSVTEANGVTTTLTYDALGRVLTNIVAGAITNSFVYSSNGLIGAVDGLGKTTALSNDLAGRVVFITNANNELTQYQYDSSGNLTNLFDGKAQKTTFQFDLFGRLTNKLNNASASILQLTYDAAGRPTTRWTPAKGNTTYRFDFVGNLTNVVYPVSSNIAMQYDSLNRLTNRTDAVGTTKYSYTAASLLASEDGPWDNDTISYNYQNRLRASLSLQQPTGSWTNGYLYDVAKRLTNLTSPAGAFGYQYSGSRPSSLVSRLALPNGAYITNTFDSIARLLSTQLKTSGGTVRNSHSYGYNLASQRTTLTNTAGDYRNYTYDAIGQLKTVHGNEANATARLNEQHGYAYDPAGNLNQRTNNALIQTFNVTNLNQLSTINRSGTLTVAGNTTTAATNVTVNTLTAARYSDKTFAKDGFTITNGDNTFTAIAQSPIGLLATNQITVNLPATNNFVYDLNGNLLSDGLHGLDYDDENQMIRVTVTNAFKKEFVYDGANRLRIRREYAWSGGWTQTNETRFICDGVSPIQHRDSNNVPTLTLTRGLDLSGSLQGAGGIGGLLAMTESSGAHSYYHADGNGNVTALINTNQLIVAKYLYDPFGYPLSYTGPKAPVNPYWFSSELYDSDTRFIHYPRRVYIPELCRFANHDPIGELGGLNLYGFVGNDPVNEIDPFGLAEHHYVVGPIRFDPELSPAAKSVFKNSTTGDIGPHDYSKPHPDYNKAVQEQWDDWIKGKNKSKLSESQAKKFLEQVKKSRDPRIKDFLDKLHEKAKKIKAAKEKLNFRMCKLRAAVAAATAIGVASALNSMADNPNYIAALQAASEGDKAGVDNAMFELASDLAIETGDANMLPTVFGIHYWMK